ncbi:MAG TPA: hypothetical protein VNP72_07530, partial [Longimicrobium sp.]|nr:hypothetical protein [Longimicrobium sp.]
FSLQLISRTPGRLDLAEPAGGRSVSHLARVRPGGKDAHDVEFEAEGEQTVPLPVPAWVEKVERVDLALSGVFPPERADPATGPPAAGSLTYQTTVVPGGAELVLDADRAACARLPLGADKLEELTAMRVRLRAEAGGAEVRVVLLANQPATSEPGEPVEGGASAPVTLEPGGEEWTTFAFPRAVELDPQDRPWAAVVVGRGRVAWPLAAADAPLRRGAPIGPWQPLPAIASAGVGGALRVVGLAPRDRPLPPLTLEVVGSAVKVEATPTARPAPVAWAAASAGDAVAPAAGAVPLRLTSRTPGTVTLRDVIITAKKKP